MNIGDGSGGEPPVVSPATTPPVAPGLVLGIAVLAVSTGSIFVRLAEAPALATAFWRLAFAVALLAPFTVTRAVRELRALGPRELRAGLAAGLFLALHFATWIRSLDLTTVAASTVIVATTPLWVAGLAPLFGSERASRGMLLGMLVSLAGAAWIGLADVAGLGQAHGPDASGLGLFGTGLTGDLLAFAGAAAAALYLLFGRRMRARVSLGTHLLFCYGSAALFLGLFALVLGEPLLGLEAPSYGWFLALALVPQLVGHSGYNWALRWTSTAMIAVVELAEPVLASLLAWWVLTELPGAGTIEGAVLVLGGFWIAARAERQKKS